MAARLTDRQKKKIVADYLETESYNATAKKNGVCGQTVRRVIEESQGITENLKRKKEENTADILAYMDSRRKQVCDIIEEMCIRDRERRYARARVRTLISLMCLVTILTTSAPR